MTIAVYWDVKNPVMSFYKMCFQDEETPSTLYKLAALLLKNDLVELDNLYPHVSHHVILGNLK